jgi:hypothetical protein
MMATFEVVKPGATAAPLPAPDLSGLPLSAIEAAELCREEEQQA